jgi:putative tributyrin esterase
MLVPVELSDPAYEVDGLRHATANSRALRRRADVTFWSPPGHDGSSLPLVVLLHGVYGSHWAWTMKAGAHRTAAMLVDDGRLPPFALAMPSDGLFGLGSGYVAHSGGDFARWILDEVPWLASESIPGVDHAAPIALAGLSMGGFGALLLGARHPERVHAVAGLSSITDFEQMRLFVGDLARYDVDDADRSVERALLAATQRPRIRFDCGTDDPLIEHNRALHRALDSAKIAHEYEEHPGGHEWPYWAEHLGDALVFLEGNDPKGHTT